MNSKGHANATPASKQYENVAIFYNGMGHHFVLAVAAINGSSSGAASTS
jgi:hypothetical protein